MQVGGKSPRKARSPRRRKGKSPRKPAPLPASSMSQGIETKSEISHKMKGSKKAEYEVPNIGKVTEELQIQYTKTGDRNENFVAIQNVYIGGELVRKVDLVAGKVLVSEPKYEPYDFLQMNEETLSKMRQNASSFGGQA